MPVAGKDLCRGMHAQTHSFKNDATASQDHQVYYGVVCAGMRESLLDPLLQESIHAATSGHSACHNRPLLRVALQHMVSGHWRLFTDSWPLLTNRTPRESGRAGSKHSNTHNAYWIAEAPGFRCDWKTRQFCKDIHLQSASTTV